MERQVIQTSDLGNATLSYSGITYTASSGTFFGKILAKISAYKNASSATADETVIQQTISYIIWNFFHFYVCWCYL